MNARNSTVSLSAPLDFINVHLRGGIIYPTQEPAINTEASRQNPLGLIVALDDNNRAEGRMFYDDGDSLGKAEGDMTEILTIPCEVYLSILFLSRYNPKW